MQRFNTEKFLRTELYLNQCLSRTVLDRVTTPHEINHDIKKNTILLTINTFKVTSVSVVYTSSMCRKRALKISTYSIIIHVLHRR